MKTPQSKQQLQKVAESPVSAADNHRPSSLLTPPKRPDLRQLVAQAIDLIEETPNLVIKKVKRDQLDLEVEALREQCEWLVARITALKMAARAMGQPVKP